MYVVVCLLVEASLYILGITLLHSCDDSRGKRNEEEEVEKSDTAHEHVFRRLVLWLGRRNRGWGFFWGGGFSIFSLLSCLGG